MATTEPAAFGVVLRRYRAAARLTQEQLAARSGLSADAIAALERGKRRVPRGATVELLADALALSDVGRAGMLAAARASKVALVARLDADADGDAGLLSRQLVSIVPPPLTQPTPLVGRVDELDAILRRLTAEGVRLLTLTGPAGVGKTRLALAAAAQLAGDSDHFPAGVIFADLTSVRDPDLVQGVIAQTLGLLDVGSRPMLDRLAETLGERRQLVVLDNFEQVLPAAAQLAELLAACPGLQVLVTSRVPLRLRWEQTLRVPPLSVPDPTAPLPPLEELGAIPSVALFMQRAHAHRADFTLSAQHAPLVAELVVQLDGLPLALELAAARLDVLSLPALARRLGDRLQLLASEAPDRPERQQSLEAAIGWSYDLLSEGERRLFRCLGVFAGRVNLEAITAVAGAVGVVRAAGPEECEAWHTLPQLLSLAEKSLILPVRLARLSWQQGAGEEAGEDEEGADQALAFDMLETVREYAWERLVAVGELETARRAHAHSFLALAERADAELRGPDQRAWFLRLECEHDNLRAALRWLLDQEDMAECAAGLRLATALRWFWTARGYHAESERWLEEALARAPQAEGGEEEESVAAARTRALAALGALLILQGKFARARAVLREALALAQQRQDPGATAEAHMYLGICAAFAGEREEAARLLHEARCRWEVLGNAACLGQTLFYLGVGADATGDVGAAAHYMAALEHLGAAGDAQYAGIVYSYLGVAEGRRGELPRAVAHIQAAVRTSVAICDRFALGFAAQAAAALVSARVAPACGARLLGATDALARATGATQTWERMLGAQDVTVLRERIAREEERSAAYREGRTLPVGEVAALALHLLEEFAQALPQPEASPADRQPRRAERSPLTEREAEVLQLVAQGHSSKAISRKLFLSASTINQHVTSVFHKLGADTRAQAVAVAAQRGLL